MIRDLTLLISKKDGDIYQNVESLKPRFDSEQDLIRHLFQEHGEGLYIIQYTGKNQKGFSKAIWRGYIRPESPPEISYMNKIDKRYLENLAGIEQKRPTDRQKIQLQQLSADFC